MLLLSTKIENVSTSYEFQFHVAFDISTVQSFTAPLGTSRASDALYCQRVTAEDTESTLNI